MSDTTLSHDDRMEITLAIMNILDSWGMRAEEQVAILNLPPKTPSRMIRRYRENTPFPDTDEVMVRLEHIVGISDALRTTYPHNPSMGKIWMRRKNRRFNERSPLQTIFEDGLDGILKVRTHLDCAFDWFEYENPANKA